MHVMGDEMKQNLLGEALGGVWDDSGHAAKVGAAYEDGPAAHSQLQVSKTLFGGLRVQPRIRVRVPPQRRLPKDKPMLKNPTDQ